MIRHPQLLTKTQLTPPIPNLKVGVNETRAHLTKGHSPNINVELCTEGQSHILTTGGEAGSTNAPDLGAKALPVNLESHKSQA